jgi:L-threonylcarbamoyladenylate synthase
MANSKLEKLDELSSRLCAGKIVVMPTDTIYGIVARALDKKAVERLYKIRRRNPKKPFIILISDICDLKKFGIFLSLRDTSKQSSKSSRLPRRVPLAMTDLNRFWPGKVSIILPCPSQKFAYLHRGTKTLAFRFPKKPSLIRLLKKTGPLVAPSANPEGLAPAKSIAEAKKHFGEAVDSYISGRVGGRPSKLVAIRNGKIEILRP